MSDKQSESFFEQSWDLLIGQQGLKSLEILNADVPSAEEVEELDQTDAEAVESAAQAKRDYLPGGMFNR